MSYLKKVIKKALKKLRETILADNFKNLAYNFAIKFKPAKLEWKIV